MRCSPRQRAGRLHETRGFLKVLHCVVQCPVAQRNGAQHLRGLTLCPTQVCPRCERESPGGVLRGLREVTQVKVDARHAHKVDMGELVSPA